MMRIACRAGLNSLFSDNSNAIANLYKNDTSDAFRLHMKMCRQLYWNRDHETFYPFMMDMIFLRLCLRAWRKT